MNFPDLPHLRHLQKDLWQWPKSRAAVMVGAGFSLNAEPLPGVNTSFPTWRQLVRAMFEELDPPQASEPPERQNRREERFNSAGPLRIASEYEAAFGRPKLDILIRAQNPDSDHQPGRLHRLLMQLPWADVFTTNYDTLLERTEIPGRTYHPVTKSSELPTAFAPRIIKLHGSFPSQTPFIITEEDYRTYPRKFAPFVNSVRQSLLENSFVLIGYSGDDPNFLEWTGWIRDELGDNHAPVYLVGPLALTSAERSLLARRDVTPIDLTPAFEGILTPHGIHQHSIEWFLSSLLAARKPRPEKWPDLSGGSVSMHVSTQGGPPPIADSAVVVPAAIEISPRGPLSADIVANVMERWRFERENYPGWVALPEQKRSELWVNTRFWFGPLVHFAKDWPAADRLLLFREINWRLEMMIAPVFSDLIAPSQRALDQTFVLLAQGRSLSASPSLTSARSASNTEVVDAWLEIAFELLRDARESYNEARWGELKTRIDTIVQQHKRHSDRNQYEAALWAMWNVERAKAKDIISRWQPPSRFPLAAMWKAGLLAELEELGEARTILRSALLEIRRALQTQGQNMELLSLEGWCTYLLFGVESSLDPTRQWVVREEFWERWQELKAWDCDPWPLQEYFEDALSAAPPKPQRMKQEVRGFDPGEVTVSLHFAGDEVSSYLPGFACIRLYERAGIPMRLRMINIAGDTLKNACRWIAPFNGFWSPALLIRAGKVDDLRKGDFLNRTQVAAMDAALANRLYGWCLQILVREAAFITGPIAMGSAQESLLEALSEVLSRLAFKVDAAELRRTFPLVLGLHRQPGVRSHPGLHDSCEPWFLRLFEAADDELLLEWLPDLIRAPLFDEGVLPGMPTGSAWPDPMRRFPSWRTRRVGKVRDDLIEKVNNATDWLLRRAASEAGEGRRRAIDRLIHVHGAKLMTAHQRQQLGELLWSKRTASNLPDRPGFAVFGFLHFPAPADVDVPSVVKSYILELSSKGAVTRDESGRTVIGISSTEQPLIFEASLASKPIVRLIGEEQGTLDWTSEEAKQLYDKARDWWANDKVAIEQAKGSPFWPNAAGSFKSTAARLGQFLARIVLPRMDWADEQEWQQLLGWLHEVRGLGSFPTLALPYVLLHRPGEADSAARIIGADINSDVDEEVSASAKAIRHWVHLSAIGLIPAPPPSLMTTLAEWVVFRRKPGINSCLAHLACLIVERPEAITPSQAALLTASLVPWHDVTILPVPGGGSGDFHESERPDLRVSLARLAGALKTWHASVSPEAPEAPAITLWRDSCSRDPLPEIRRAFDFWDQIE